MAPLYSALAGKPKSLQWETPQKESFITSKMSFIAATILSFLAPDDPLFLFTYAINIAMGAVLNQVISGTPHHLDFSSRKLSTAEKNDSTFNCELLDIYLAMRNFHHILGSVHFTINTNHQPLMHAFSRIQDAWSA